MEELLRLEYHKLKSTELTVTGKCNILNNIVQLKLQEPVCEAFQNDVSVDIKRYLNSIIEVAELGAKNYDAIKDEKISELLESISPADQVRYIDYWIRQLKKSSFDDEIKKYQKLKTKTIILNSVKNFWCMKSWIQLIVYIPIYNILTLLLTLIGLTLLACIILLPAPFEPMGVLNIDLNYSELSVNFYTNHFVNVIAALVGVNSEFEVIPKDIVSQVSLIFAKVFVFIYIVTVLLNKLGELIKR